MTFCLGMVSMLFCHLDSDFPRPLIHQHPSTRLCLKIRSRHGTQISCLGSKHPPPDQPLISVPCLPVTQHCLLPLPPTFVSTPYFMTRREYPHDHGAPVSDQRRRSSILTSISWSSATFEGLTGPSSSLFMTSWSRIGFCRNERMYLPSFEWFFVIVIYTSSCRMEHSSIWKAGVGSCPHHARVSRPLKEICWS